MKGNIAEAAKAASDFSRKFKSIANLADLLADLGDIEQRCRNAEESLETVDESIALATERQEKALQIARDAEAVNQAALNERLTLHEAAVALASAIEAEALAESVQILSRANAEVANLRDAQVTGEAEYRGVISGLRTEEEQVREVLVQLRAKIESIRVALPATE